MENNIDESIDDQFDESENTLNLDDDDSEIDSDCNESQPCRGDECSLPQDPPEDID